MEIFCIIQMRFRIPEKRFALSTRFNRVMNYRNHSIWLSILMASLLIAAGQLPPEIMADRHRVRLDRLISENRHQEAYRLTSEIVEFYEKHDLELPHEFHFKQARVASSLGLPKEAITALHAYLNKAGKEGARYLDALELLDRAEERLKEAEAERKRIEAERRRAEAIRKRHTELVNRQIQSASVPLARDPLSSGGLGPEMVTVAKGRFQHDFKVWGLSGSRVRWVEIEQPFAISRYEVTRGEFRRFVKATRYRTEAEQKGGNCPFYGDGYELRNVSWKRPGFDQTDTHPVGCVSRRDAMAYTKWLSRETGRNYRLPTAVEWQYAARAGSDLAMLPKPLEDTEAMPNPCGRANLEERAAINKRYGTDCFDGVRFTAPVGSFPPNGIGLHDMIGNVEEWVSSCFIEGKGLFPQDENAGDCDTPQQHLTASTGYSSLENSVVYSNGTLFYAYRRALSVMSFESSQVPDRGFRLVKDFELKKKTGETGDVVE